MALDYNQIMNQIAQNRQDVGQRIASIPQTYEQYAPTNDAEYNSIRSAQTDKIKQLFDHDSQMATTYFQPQEAAGPHAPGYTPPEARVVDPMIGLQAANTQLKATANEAVDLGKAAQTRKDVLDTALNKGLAMINSVIEAKKFEQSSLMEQMNLMLKKQEMEQKMSQENSLAPLLEQILNIQNKRQVRDTAMEDATPTSLKQGMTKTKGKQALKDIKDEYRRIKAQYPDAKVDFTQLDDGSYEYNFFVPRMGQKYLSGDEYQDYTTNPVYSDPEGTINKLAAASVASGAKASDVASVLERFGILSPVEKAKSTTNQKTTEADRVRQDVDYGVNAALNILNSTQVKLGAVQGPLENWKAKLNKADPDTIKFNLTIAELMATIAKARGGTSFTPSEKAMLEAYAPKVGDSEQEVRTKLEMLKTKLGSTQTGDGGSQWEVVQ